MVPILRVHGGMPPLSIVSLWSGLKSQVVPVCTSSFNIRDSS
jgi:hypothetical protein